MNYSLNSYYRTVLLYSSVVSQNTSSLYLLHVNSNCNRSSNNYSYNRMGFFPPKTILDSRFSQKSCFKARIVLTQHLKMTQHVRIINRTCTTYSREQKGDNIFELITRLKTGHAWLSHWQQIFTKEFIAKGDNTFQGKDSKQILLNCFQLEGI